MKKTLLTLLILFFVVGCSNTAHITPDINIKVTVSDLTTEEYSEVGTTGLINPSINDFKKLSLNIGVINESNSEVKIDVPSILEIKNALNQNGEDRYWYGSYSGPNQNAQGYWLGNTPYQATIVFYARGLSYDALRERLQELKITSQVITATGESTVEYLVGDLLTFQ